MKAWKLSLLVANFLLCVACGNQNQKETIDLGVIAGPEANFATEVQKIANKNNYEFRLQPQIYDNYNAMALALCEGKMDAAIEPASYFQQQLLNPDLQAAMKSMHCELAPLTQTFIYTMGIYSRTLNNLNELASQAVVAVPSPPLNLARALLLLQSAGLIQLRPEVSTYATVSDIVSNPRQLVIVPINPSQLSQSMAEASLIVISSLYSVETGALAKDALYTESSPRNAMLILVRKPDLQNIEFAGLVALYHSSPVIAAAEKMTGNGAVPAWNSD